VSREYFGSYSLDGLAVALHAVYHTSSFNDAIVKTVNFCGDADTTGAIAGQVCSLYHRYN
jgi:ADP-ribosyl-[dinitrogen reductase] hydrolase